MYNGLQLFVFISSSGFILVYSYFWSVFSGTGCRHNRKKTQSLVYSCLPERNLIIRYMHQFNKCSLY